MLEPHYLPAGRRAASVLLAALLLLTACREEPRFRIKRAAAQGFGERETAGLVACDALKEASGLAASRANPGVLWAHNDSGDKPRVFALGAQGEHLGIYTLLGAQAVDWEDMAVGPGPQAGREYLYLADIGDNLARRETKTVYRIPEPKVSAGQAPIESALAGAEAIQLRYPDRPRNAETLLVDPVSRDLYIVTKQEETVSIYRAAYPQPIDRVLTMEDCGRLALSGVVGGDVSPDGSAILLKTYAALFVAHREPGERLDAALIRGGFERLPYTPEPQGEAVTWTPDGGAYFTLSEEREGTPAVLYRYARLSEPAAPAKR
jgi:hypothetical protein